MDEELQKSGISTTYIYRFTDLKNAAGEALSFFIQFEKGRCNVVRETGAHEDAEFVGSADYITYSQLSKGELDGLEAIKAGRLKLKYSPFKAIRYSSALKRVSKIAQALQVEY